MHTVLILMGVSGCGKTLIGEKLSQQVECQFIEGDDYHSLENKKKMGSGLALDDKDRESWLVRDEIIQDPLRVAGHLRCLLRDLLVPLESRPAPLPSGKFRVIFKM